MAQERSDRRSVAVMTVQPEDVPLKVQQLDGDVNEIYELIDEVKDNQKAHSVRLDRIEKRLEGTDGRLEGMEQSLSGRIDSLAEKVDGLSEQMAVVVRAVVRDDE